MDMAGMAHLGTATLRFSPSTGEASLPARLPVTAAVVVRDAGFSLADLLFESKALRDQISPLGLERPRTTELPIRQPVVVLWVVPDATFDDEDWPGGEDGMDAGQLRAARREQAGAWLAREGIGLVATE
jgi:hypothetical protein